MRTSKKILISVLLTIMALILVMTIMNVIFLKLDETITENSILESNSVYFEVYSEEIMELIVLQHLSEKYNGQEFIVSYASNSYGGWLTPYWECYPKGGDSETDKVYVELIKNENGETIFRDDYFGILIREDIEAEVIETCVGMGMPMKVYSEGLGRLDNSFDSTKTYADLKQAIMEGKEDCTFDISIFLLCEDIENREEYANQIFDQLSEDGFDKIIDICMIADEKIYDQITRKNCYDIFEKDDKTMFKFHEYIDGR